MMMNQESQQSTVQRRRKRRKTPNIKRNRSDCGKTYRNKSFNKGVAPTAQNNHLDRHLMYT